jgi:hypothetical protein
MILERPVHIASASLFLVISWMALSAPTAADTVSVRQLATTEHLCERCLPGDYVASNGHLEIVVGASHRADESFYKFATADSLGSIVFARPAGSGIRGDIMLGTPYVRVGNTTQHILYDRLDVLEGSAETRFTASGTFRDNSGTALRFTADFFLAADAKHIPVSLTVTNIGTAAVRDVVYSLYFDPHQIYDFSPGDEATHSRFQFRGYPRENHLYAWSDPTPRVSGKGDYYFGWDGGLILADAIGVDFEPGQTRSRAYTLFAGGRQGEVLAAVYGSAGVSTFPIVLELQSGSGDYIEIIVRDAVTSAVFYRSFLDRPVDPSIELPAGEYSVTANFFPAQAECRLTVSPQGANRCVLKDLPQGRISVDIVDAAGNRVPGKVSFNGLGETRTPYLRPVNPTRSEGYWESARNSVFPTRAAEVVNLPVGAYRVSASAGPEYSIEQRELQVSAGSSETLVLHVERVIDRPDLVSMDPHLHTLASDGAVDSIRKVQALLASGIDVAIATDHNLPIDYTPALQELGMQDRLRVYAGAEVTVPERLDYNTYPMAVIEGAKNNGAIDAKSPDVSSRFKLSRERDPGVILQINHPRSWQFDYFNWFGLDPESAAFAYEGFDFDFDVLEVVNSAHYDTAENMAARRDWFNLLRRGYFYPLVGSSDSHEIDQDEPGFSRTYLYRDNAGGWPMSTASLLKQIRRGHSFASNGPILDLTVQDKYRPGDLAPAPEGRARVRIDVWAAPWIEVDKVQLFVNGEPRLVQVKAIQDSRATHLQGHVDLDLQQDVFVVAEATGTKDLWPVLQHRQWLPEPDNGVKPFALSNPVFVDVDGNGEYDPPLPRRIELRPRAH